MVLFVGTRGRQIGKSVCVIPGVNQVETAMLKRWRSARLPRNRFYSPKVTVPKPTQVGGKNILRRAREFLLRNSANYPCNFGRRGATRCEDLRDRSIGWPQRKGPGDCLSKTQHYAKPLRRSIWCDACPMPKGQKEGLASAKL